MIIALIALSLVNAKQETPVVPSGKIECASPAKPNTKTEPSEEVDTENCTVVTVPTKPEKVRR